MPGASRGEHRVLIIDDHLLFAESLELALSLEGYDVRRLEPPDEGGSMATLRSLALRANPRTVLLDLDLGRFGDGINLVAPLARANANVVVLTASDDVGRWGACMRLGARKVLSKTGALQQALATVRRLHQGLPVVTAARSSSRCSRPGPATARPTTTYAAGSTCSRRASDRCWARSSRDAPCGRSPRTVSCPRRRCAPR